jgi:DNA-binding winged helix-turn-helix (wHTH) protein/tetratricopeptide (TPR) repeat protein/TolB-like protein
MNEASYSRGINDIHLFGAFRLEARERRLWRGNEPITLKPKVFDTLLLLVQNAGHLVTKEELMSSLWPDAVVDEGNLTKNVWLLRKALGDADGGSPIIETVPKVGYRFVAAVRSPELEKPPRDEVSPQRKDRSKRTLPLSAAAVLCVLAIAAWVWRSRAQAPIAPPGSLHASLNQRRSVAVLGFKNLSGRPDVEWLSTAVSEMMSAELAAGEKLRLVPMENVVRIAGARAPDTPGALSRQSLANLRARLDADLVLSGSYVALSSPNGGAVRLDMTLQETTSGESLATVSETGEEGDLFKLVASAGSSLRSGLGLAPATSAESAGVAVSHPRDRDAARFYAEGLGKLRVFDALAAQPLLETSIRAERDFGPAHEALSETWSALGFEEKARTEAEEAFRLARDSPPLFRAAAEARLAETRKEWSRAEALNASVLRSHPDDLEVGLRLASVQVAGGRASEALATLSNLATLRAPARDDPRIDLVRADAFGALSQWREELAASTQAAEKAQRHGSTLLLAGARLREAGASRDLGDATRGRRSYESAAELFRGAGDSNGEAESLIGIANASSDEGKYDEALDVLRQAQATFARIGNRKGEARALSDVAILEWLRGDLDAVLLEDRQILALNRAVNDQRGIVWGLNATGNVLADQGQFDRALELQEEALGISRRIGDDEYLAYSLGSLADTFLAQGRLEDSRRNYESALALSKKLGDPEGIATHENDLGTVFCEEGEFPRAEIHYEAALAGRRKLGLKDVTAESQMLLAGLRNAEGRYSEAAPLAEEAARVFHGLRQTGNEAISLAEEARAKVGLAKVAEAHSLCERARSLLKDNRQNGANLPVLLESVRVETAAANVEEARTLLSDLQARAEKAGWLLYSLEARRAGAEIEILSGRKDAGLREIASLAEEARRKGFGVIVAESKRLLENPSLVGR